MIGGCGYLGIRVAQFLNDSGYDVYCVDVVECPEGLTR